MKNLNLKLFLVVSLIFMKCSIKPVIDVNNSIDVNEDLQFERIYYSNTQEEYSYEVTKNDAILLAQNYFTMEAEYHRKGQDLKKVKKVKELKDSNTNETLIYVIEYEQGFCLVSADSRFDPILAYSDTSEWTGETLEGPSILLNIYKKEIKERKDKKEKQSKELKSVWKRLSKKIQSNSIPTNTQNRIIEPGCIYGECRPIYCDYYYFVTVGPLVDPIARWGQSGSFSYYSPSNNGCDCDKSPTGCGPIALGMLMRYHRYPTMNMQFNGDFAYTDYDNMPLYKGSCSNNSGGYKSSAMLVRLCGSATNTIYGVLGTCNSATQTNNIGDGLNFFGYSHDGKGDLSSRYDAINNDLKNSYPVILCGAKNALGDDWHIWLADGYKEYSTETWYNNETCDDPYFGSNPYECGVCPDCVTCSTYFSLHWHMNWGWNGQNNGWFIANRYTIGEYDNLMKAYTNIRPN